MKGALVTAAGLSRYGYKYREILVNPTGHATSDAGGMVVAYVGVAPLGARAGGLEDRGVTAVMVAVRLKVVYESPQPKGKRGTILFLLRYL